VETVHDITLYISGFSTYLDIKALKMENVVHLLYLVLNESIYQDIIIAKMENK